MYAQLANERGMEGRPANNSSCDDAHLDVCLCGGEGEAGHVGARRP